MRTKVWTYSRESDAAYVHRTIHWYGDPAGSLERTHVFPTRRILRCWMAGYGEEGAALCARALQERQLLELLAHLLALAREATRCNWSTTEAP